MKMLPRKELYLIKIEEAAATETKRRSWPSGNGFENWKKMREEKRSSVDEDDMPQVVADWTGIP